MTEKKQIMDKIEAIRIKKGLSKSDFARLLRYRPSYYIHLSLGIYEKRSVASLTRILENAQSKK